jgi:hypothetical protein
MDDQAFQELLENARLAAAWLKGENTATRITSVGEPDPRKIPVQASHRGRAVQPDASAKTAATLRNQV